MNNYRHVSVRADTFKLKEKCKDIFREEHPRDLRPISDDFITRECYLFYIYNGNIPDNLKRDDWENGD